MTRGLCATLLLLVASCGGNDSGGDTPPALTASVVEVIQGDGQTDTVGQQLPLAIRVQVMDTASVSTAAGFAPPEGTPVPVPGQLVNFVVTSGGGSVFAGAALTDSLGRAQELWTLGPTAGAQCLEARAVDQETGQPLTFAQVCATAVPGPLSSAAFAVHFLHAEAGVPFSIPITAVDQYGNAVAPPAPTSLDSVQVAAVGNDWQGLGTGPGTPRLVLGTDTLFLTLHPRSGPYDLKLMHGDTVWHETGTYQPTATGSSPPWCGAPSDAPRDSSRIYRAVNVLVTRQIGAGAVDTIAAAAVRDSVLCHRTFTTDYEDDLERSVYLRPLFAYFLLMPNGEFPTLPFERDSVRAFFPLNIGGLRDTLFVTP